MNRNVLQVQSELVLKLEEEVGLVTLVNNVHHVFSRLLKHSSSGFNLRIIDADFLLFFSLPFLIKLCLLILLLLESSLDL